MDIEGNANQPGTPPVTSTPTPNVHSRKGQVSTRWPVEYTVEFDDGTRTTVWSKKGEVQAVITARLQTRKFGGKATVEEVTKGQRS